MWAVVMKPWFWPTAHGHDRVPISGPVILASNHSSFLDPLLVGTMTRRQVRFVARATLADFPIIGWWMRAVGTRFVDRGAVRSSPAGGGRAVARGRAGRGVSGGDQEPQWRAGPVPAGPASFAEENERDGCADGHSR